MDDAIGWVWCAAVCAGCAVAAALAEADVGGRLRALPGRMREDWVPSAPLVLQLLDAALASGVSIPRALRAVGVCCAGPCAEAFAAVCDELAAGASWDDAWNCAADDPRLAGIAATVCATLREPWNDGVAAGAQLGATMEQLETTERMEIERASSRLSVRLLLPMGLCFLPAFLCIAVIPTIISFAR